MPFAVYVLGLAVFAQGTSEFMLSGLVPDIAGDLHVSISAAGSLTSAFAVGMVIGAPLMAVLSLRWSRRRALLAFLVAFLLVHVLGAVTTSYGVLLATRVRRGAGQRRVPGGGPGGRDRDGRARRQGACHVRPARRRHLACVAGCPPGRCSVQLWGWRSAFWAVALVSRAGRVRDPAVGTAADSGPTAPPSARGGTARAAQSPAAGDAAAGCPGERRDVLHVHLSRAAGHRASPASGGPGCPPCWRSSASGRSPG